MPLSYFNPVGIFLLASCHLHFSFVFRENFTFSFDILTIFKHSVIHVCGLIFMLGFYLSLTRIHFFFVFTVFRICGSLHNMSFIPQDFYNTLLVFRKYSAYFRGIMVRETWVQSHVVSLLKWYLLPPRLTLSDIKCVSRVKWSNPGKGVWPSPTPRCSSYWKRSLLVAFDYGRQLYLLIIIPLIENLLHRHKLMVFHLSLSDNKFPPVLRTLRSILVHHSNAVVWIITILPLISNSSGLFPCLYAPSKAHHINWYHCHSCCRTTKSIW